MCLLIFCFFFFFKQKTAYEMRISDWSSDVCSSDLIGHLLVVGRAVIEVAGADLLFDAADAVHQARRTRLDPRPRELFITRIGQQRFALGRKLVMELDRKRRVIDRKSVVSGKSVSVRVDLGGRRIIKKKNRQ